MQQIKLRKLLSVNEIVIFPCNEKVFGKKCRIFFSEMENYKQLDLGNLIFTKNHDEKMTLLNGEKLLKTIIFISAIFNVLNRKSYISNYEAKIFEDMVKFETCYRVNLEGKETQFFKEFIINRSETKRFSATSQTQKSIADCYEFFVSELEEKSGDEIENILKIVENAVCNFSILELN